MKFYDLVKKLQNENEGYIILVRCGIFYNAIGKDAVFMQEKFGLGTICIKSETCKNGIPVSTIQKFIPKLQKSGYSYKILERKIKDRKVLWLTKEIIYSNKGDIGLPIGIYTSQIFANIYLNELDQYVKHKLKCKYYFRYMDDCIILVKTKEEAKQILEEIKEFLKRNLELELNSKTQIFKSKQGVNFCGYKINEYRLKIRDKGKRKLKKKVKELKYKIMQGEVTSKEAKKYLAGHLGYIKIANTYNLEKKLFE